MNKVLHTIDNDPRPAPPEPPLPGDCCDSGCDPCVNDTYTEELLDYRERLARWLERHPEAAGQDHRPA
ncbi:oxidoreductase-like domain-containing protein [Luteimonas granuli]|uniref:Oxidoreductase-like protein n=1 Tax=Luteimonas granuli TaxID=1176533 RepID=A0A518N4G7_9GAMM|nr:oxidoreductase-like domain-containing protein [Luteimonas granuli]QDW66811.1 oxidoreductase-like protein [Luteimonas granuli]